MIDTQTLFICIVATIGSIHAKIPYNELQVNIFDDRPSDFEFRTIESTQIVKSFFARDDVSILISAGMVALQNAPCMSEFAKLIPLIRNTMEDQSEWRSVFTKVIADETMYAVTESEIRWMETSVQTIQSTMKLLDDDNSDVENRKTTASIIHTDLNRMINFFDLKSSLFRKYPLVGAPLLIQLASLIAVFSPIAQALIPMEAKNPQISCKIRDALLDYRLRTVNARLREMHTRFSTFNSLVKVMLLPYNAYGYNQTNPGAIDCTKGCKQNPKIPIEDCLEDKFGTDIYDVEIHNGTSVCVEDYTRFIRDRVEKLFPVELLDKLCVGQTAKDPTGSGWFTINIQFVYVFGEKSGKPCKLDLSDGCDPFIKLFVNNELVLKTPKLVNKFSFDAKITFTTAKVPKNSTIKIEIWHAKSRFWDSDALILDSEGNIESFLNEPLRKGNHHYENDNWIETMSFWRDEIE